MLRKVYASFATARTEWKISDEAIFCLAPFMTVGGQMSNDKSSGVRRAARAELHRPRHAKAGPTLREADFTKRPRYLADLSRSPADRRKIGNDDFAVETFTLPLEAARRKARDIIDEMPQRGCLGIVERWRQLPDWLIEFTVRHLPISD